MAIYLKKPTKTKILNVLIINIRLFKKKVLKSMKKKRSIWIFILT